MTLKIIIDGGSDFPPEWLEEYDVDVIPINIIIGDQQYLQGIDLSNEDFYRLAEQGSTMPKTSQPSPHQFVEFYKRVAQAGDTILSMHVSSKLSGTVNSAVIAAKELASRYQIHPFDTLSGSAGVAYMFKEARLMERAGASLQAILERMDYIRRNMTIVLTLDTLEYAWRSGRIKAIQAVVASLINVKPIAILGNGMLDVREKVRTRGRSIERVLELVHERVQDKLVNVAVVHSRAAEAGKDLMDKVRQTLNVHELIMTDLSISVAANLGPGTIGIAAYPVKDGR